MPLLLTRNEFLERLQKNVVLVNFTKVNGEVRNLRCTLQESYIPKSERANQANRYHNDSVMNVWDVEKDDWRSFRLDSVNSVMTPAPDPMYQHRTVEVRSKPRVIASEPTKTPTVSFTDIAFDPRVSR